MSEAPLVAMAAFAAAFGAVVGSFGATAALRLEAGISTWSGRSQCDGCNRRLTWVETVPLAGYVLCHGRCTSCGHGINGFHLLGEVLGAITAVSATVFSPYPENILLVLIGMVLLIQGLIDLRTLRLPNLGNLMIAGLCAAIAVRNDALFEGAIAAALSAVILFFVKAWLERRKEQTLLGLGDVKLIAALAVALGQWTAAMVAIASIITLLTMLILKSGPQAKLPFGPAIALASFVLLLGLANGNTVL